MKSLINLCALTVILLAVLTGCEETFQMTTPASDPVEQLISQMTIEEKVGEMTQLTLETISKNIDDTHVQIDQAKLEEAIVKYHVGSILNCGGSANTIENWHEIITKIQDVATKKTRLKIPNIYGIDSIHGTNYIVNGTLFPQNFAMAATGNVKLVSSASAITAMETRAAGIPWNFNPVLGLARNPLWSRFYETFGEDPYIASVMGSAYVKAQQGNDISSPDKVAACMKHYLGYSVPRTGKDRTPAHIPDRLLREKFLKPFAAAVDAGVVTAMINSSEINGIPVHSSKYYLIDMLRGELGFEGFVVSDWNDINNLWQREKVAATQRDAVKMAVMAGIDMSMVPYDFKFTTHLIDLVKSGEVPESRIDEAVRRILKVKYDLGLFDNPYPNPEDIKKLAAKESTAANLQAARECITLLKNENDLLPLAKDAKVLLTGPTANLISVMNGGWTITWQGEREDLYPEDKDTVLEAIQRKIGDENVTYIPADFDKPADTQAIKDAARNAEVAIVCLGEKTYCETPGNIDDLTLDVSQLNLASQIASTGTPVVVVLLEGRPRIVSSIVDQVDGIIMGYLPGNEGGTAIADVLFGDVNPSGRLPFTYPKNTGDLTLYDHKNSESYNPQWPFGHGLSYTTFACSDLAVSKSEIEKTENFTVSVKVKNTGKRAGKQIIQLYIQDMVASVTPSVRQLKRFTKIDLQPNQSQNVTFILTPEDLSFIGRENTPVLEPGQFKVYVADQEAEFKVKDSSE